MVLPVLMAVTVGLVWLLTLAAAQVRTIDAAREVVRALARGDEQDAAFARGLRIGVPGTRLSVTTADGEVAATARAVVSGPGGLFRFLPGVTVHARAVGAEEEGGSP